MISPLLGPSTIIHVFVIFVGGTIKSAKKIYKKIKTLKEKKNRARVFSIVIISTVCIIMLTVSFFVISLGFKSNRSNLNIIEGVFSKKSSSAGLINAPSVSGEN
jgi:hypothetical protein